MSGWLGWAGWFVAAVFLVLLILLPVLRSGKRQEERRRELALAEWARNTGAPGYISEIVSTSAAPVVWQDIYAACNGKHQFPPDAVKRIDLIREVLTGLKFEDAGLLLTKYRDGLKGLDNAQLHGALIRFKDEYTGNVAG